MPALERRTKTIGDAGEHYVLAQLTFAGAFAAKMPDNWKAYDLVVEGRNGLERVSVKTRTETAAWTDSGWFRFDDRQDVQWLACVFRSAQGALRAWMIPFDVARKYARPPSATRKQAWQRELPFRKLTVKPFSMYEDNWSLERHEPLSVQQPDRTSHAMEPADIRSQSIAARGHKKPLRLKRRG